MKLKMNSLSSVALAALCVCATPVQADPLSLKLSETVSYDSNYARNETNQSEVVSTTGVALNLNKLYGRQNYFASGRFDINKYRQFKDRDNNSYDVNGRFVSEFASNWAVAVSGGRSQYLNSVENNPLNQRLSKSEVTQSNTGMNLQYGVAGRWSLLGSLGAARTSYSLSSLDYLDRAQDSGGLRLVYNTSDLLSFGLGVSSADTEYKNQIVNGTSEDVKQRSLDFSTNWQLTGLTRLDAILSYAKNKYKSDSNANFKGLTGRLNWNFNPGGATTYTLALARDTNNDGSGTGLRNNLTYYNNQIDALLKQNLRYADTFYKSVINSLNGQMHWTPTAKLAFNANLGWDQYEVSRSVPALNFQPGKSTSDYVVVGLTADYQFSRAIAFNCNIQHYKQTADDNPQASSGIPRIAYDGNQVGCSASFTID